MTRKYALDDFWAVGWGMRSFVRGFEGCETPWALGWKHGAEDIEDTGDGSRYRPNCVLTFDERDRYKQGYDEAQWDWKEEDAG